MYDSDHIKTIGIIKWTDVFDTKPKELEFYAPQRPCNYNLFYITNKYPVSTYIQILVNKGQLYDFVRVVYKNNKVMVFQICVDRDFNVYLKCLYERPPNSKLRKQRITCHVLKLFDYIVPDFRIK